MLFLCWHLVNSISSSCMALSPYGTLTIGHVSTWLINRFSRTVHTNSAHVFSHCSAQPGRGVNVTLCGFPPRRSESPGPWPMRTGRSYSNGVLHRVTSMWRCHFPAICQTVLARYCQQPRYAWGPALCNYRHSDSDRPTRSPAPMPGDAFRSTIPAPYTSYWWCKTGIAWVLCIFTGQWASAIPTRSCTRLFADSWRSESYVGPSSDTPWGQPSWFCPRSSMTVELLI